MAKSTKENLLLPRAAAEATEGFKTGRFVICLPERGLHTSQQMIREMYIGHRRVEVDALFIFENICVL